MAATCQAFELELIKHRTSEYRSRLQCRGGGGMRYGWNMPWKSFQKVGSLLPKTLIEKSTPQIKRLPPQITDRRLNWSW